MTPLVAGIALTGKAPVYENVYMSGLKQKAAGEAARKKELSETEKQIRNSLKITGGTYHPTFHERVKDLTSTALAKSLEAMEKDPVRGVNAALQIVNDATNVLGVYSENSKKLFEIEKPQYQKDFYAPSSFISAIGQKSFDEVMADQNLAKELEKYNIEEITKSQDNLLLSIFYCFVINQLDHYNRSHCIEDLLKFLLDAVRCGVIDNGELVEILNSKHLLVGGIGIGVYPKDMFVKNPLKYFVLNRQFFFC